MLESVGTSSFQRFNEVVRFVLEHVITLWRRLPMARCFGPSLLRRRVLAKIVWCLMYGIVVVSILSLSWKLFSGSVDHTSHTSNQDTSFNVKNRQGKTNVGQNGTKRDPPSCENITVLILGFHLQSWSKTVPQTRDRLINCPAEDVCVHAHYSPVRQNLLHYNVVLFSHLYMELRNFKSNNWFQLLKQRPPRQRWVMFSLQPPVWVGLNTSVPKRAQTQSFHWTLTYDLHSDIPLPYGRYSKFDIAPKIQSFDGKALLSAKTGLVAFLSSNCDKTRWPRSTFVKTFQKVLSIDTYGKCGKLSCEPNCFNVLKRYKFILALENSQCQGYITEHFWNALQIWKAVPIVFGPLKEDYEALAPPNSFIHIYDFKSMTSLAKYIIELDAKDDDYLAYHSWRNNGTLKSVVHDWSKLPFDETYCDIARRYKDDMKMMRKKRPVKFRNVNGKDWLDTCQVHAIRPRGKMDHLPIPIS
ncbi:putative glycoprotein 3-alpha-L-fucosyltransferase A-like [Apostichopus japonicus]|uniref:Fucosyltransferase n=1 Tax=Stichopus japonicus TaxID=307972 RepID=A0A2G8LIP6_STIJA|nr:putative glycoprotein 3-alpha-L-fucosyltransferase A-like [Apostichopus japonicus]